MRRSTEYERVGLGEPLQASGNVWGLAQCEDLSFFAATDFANDD
jgi:hypothetical protein